jgi:thiamine-monophosphate kinase
VLGRGFRSPATVVNAHRAPEPPYAAGPEAALAGATAMIDISDGLIADLGHLARASGVSVEVRTSTMPVHERVLDVAAALGADPMQWLLVGGEDYALAATFPSARLVPGGWSVVGEVLPGSGVLVDGNVFEGDDEGWQHWR